MRLEFDDSTRNAYEGAWEQLRAAVRERRHDFHTFALATIDTDGFPQIRTMVLRGADPEKKILQFNSDARSPKIAELRLNPQASALFYSAEKKLQIRAWGQAVLHHNDTVSATVWEAMQRMSRDCYRTPFAPSSECLSPPPKSTLLDLPEAYANLVVVRLVIEKWEWLSLSSEGHQRLRFSGMQNVCLYP